MSKKIKVLTIGDHPLSPSGVGTQTRYVCEALLESGKFEVISLGGAIKHNNYEPMSVEPWAEEWRIFPVDGYGTQDMIRSLLRNEKPDILWIMTDPRFYGWLWMIENEIRPLCPIVYYHVWDNYPYPNFNRQFYLSNDLVVAISKLTEDVVRNVAPEVKCTYLPHAVDSSLFTRIGKEQRKAFRQSSISDKDVDKFIIFWNNRNARRKQSGTLIWWFKEWLDKRDLHDKAQLIMHTDPKDSHGQDLIHIVEELGLDAGQVLFSTTKVPLEKMPQFYNLVDVTVNISDAEGFGLSTLESLSCGTPIIATVTGGLQEQVIAPGKQFGVPLFPVSKVIIGSQEVPYIYEDRVSKEHFLSALNNLYDMGEDARLQMGKEGRQHVLENYNFTEFKSKWVKLMLDLHEEQGSWI
jgi:glycosyltransferase involved in cell wall biosynthesis